MRQSLVPKSNRGKYCGDCARTERKRKKAEYERIRRNTMDIQRSKNRIKPILSVLTSKGACIVALRTLKIILLTVHGIQVGRREAYTKTLHSEKWDIPQFEIDALARCILPAIQKFFETEEGKMKFEEWKKKQEKK